MQLKLDVIVCTTRVRTQETAKVIQSVLGYSVPIEIVEKSLGAKNILTCYAYLQEKYKNKNVLLVGHNEGFGIVDSVLGKDPTETFTERRAKNPNGKIIELPTILRENRLDRWIMSELELTIASVSTEFERYDLQKAATHLVGFLDNLTNWYIRRSRRRFWKSENDGDKLQAYQTLYDVLVTFTKTAAPFIPFITEEIWKGLTQ